jgi:hypothetical protein
MIDARDSIKIDIFWSLTSARVISIKIKQKTATTKIVATSATKIGGVFAFIAVLVWSLY